MCVLCRLHGADREQRHRDAGAAGAIARRSQQRGGEPGTRRHTAGQSNIRTALNYYRLPAVQ